MITPEDKDALLRYLCENAKPEKFYTVLLTDIRQGTALSDDHLDALFTYFTRNKLLIDGFLHFTHAKPSASFIVTVEAFDVFRRGGFAFQEKVLQQEVEKLSLEIERLRPSLGDKIEQISTIAANLKSLISPFG